MNSNALRFVVRICMLAVLLVGHGCSTPSVPKATIRSTDASYISDLGEIQEYIDTMPADVVVAGYPKDTAVEIQYTVDASLVQTTYRGVVLKRLTPQYSVFRSRTDTSQMIVVPTKSLSRISVNGIRKKRSSPATGWSLILLSLAGIALLSTWGLRSAEAADLKDYYRLPPVNSCLVVVAIIVLAGASIAVALSMIFENAQSGDHGRYERVVSTWRFQ